MLRCRLASFGAALPVLGHLHQLVDGVQKAEAVLPQQLLVQPLVSEAHFQEHGHHGRVLLGAGVDASLHSDKSHTFTTAFESLRAPCSRSAN